MVLARSPMRELLGTLQYRISQPVRSVSLAWLQSRYSREVNCKETLGSVTTGDVLAEGFAAANGALAYSHNDEGSLDVIVRGRNQGIAIAAIAEDGGVFVDETEEASSNATADMTLLPTTQALNDAYYFGHNEDFNRLKLDISTARTGTYTYYVGVLEWSMGCSFWSN